ncbi:MAG TPA: RDD family protein [Blastocatellia bacterium]|nr:RDD family protein [Blastocatellia bacterium]
MAPTRLDDELIVETPERVELYYALASIGNRFLAAFIDHLIQAVSLALLVLVTGFVTGWAMFVGGSAWTVAMGIVGAFVLYWGYFVVFETIWNGQTPGKRIMRLRVIREDGRPVRFFEVFVRNIIRLVIDFQIPPFYAVGVASIVLSPNSKRVGDFVAGTVVVKERAREAPSLADIVRISEIESVRIERTSQQAMRLDLTRLTEKDVRALQSFLKRRYELGEPSRTILAGRIAGSIVTKLGADPGGLRPEDVLEEIERQYRTRSYSS